MSSRHPPALDDPSTALTSSAPRADHAPDVPSDSPVDLSGPPKVVIETYEKPHASKTASSDKSSQWWLLNVIAPALILLAGFVVVKVLGTVTPSQRPPLDRSPAGILKSLTPVRTVAVRSLAATGQPLRLQADGEVVPYREAVVAAEVAGRIVSKSDRCEAGQFVRAGDELMQIDRTDLQLEVERLQRAQEQAYESLGEIDAEIAGTNRLIEVAKRDVQLQIREVRRQRNLPEGFNTGRDIDAAEKALLNAEQALVTQQNRLESLKAQRSRLEASERLAATQLKAAEVNLQRTKITAPIDGIIVNENADVDSFVSRGTALLTIETTEKVEIDSNLRPDQLYWVLNQQTTAGRDEIQANRFAGYEIPETPAIISYELSGLENQTYRWKGRLVSYDGIGLDPQTRTVPVRILVDDPRQNVDADGNPVDVPGSPALVRGMFVLISLQIEPTANLVVVPAAALQPGNRVLEFIADPSVLEIASVPTKPAGADNELDNGPGNEPDNQPERVEGSAAIADTGSDAGSDGTAVVDNSDPGEDGFDVAAWRPGRIVLRRNITPIDSLSPSEDATDNSDRDRRQWVCEVPEGTLGDGSEVVVSPVGNFDGEEMSARAQTAPKTTGAK